MAGPGPIDPDRQLEELCRILSHCGVRYVVFGSHVARLNGIALETVDVDVVPDRERANLEHLAEALNLVGARWRIEGLSEGMKIDGGLEARHFLGDSVAVGLLTRLGPVDVVLEPRGFEQGYAALSPTATTMWRGGIEIRVGALADLVHSKQLLRRAKDLEHLALVYEQHPELAPGVAVDRDDDLDLGF